MFEHVLEFESVEEFDAVASYLKEAGFSGSIWLGTVNTGPATGYKWIQNDCFVNGDMTSSGNPPSPTDSSRQVEFKVPSSSVSSNSGQLKTDPKTNNLAVLCEVFP